MQRRRVAVALIDPLPLRRASMRSMLRSDGPHFDIHAFPDAAALLGDGGLCAELDLVLVALGSARIRDAAVRATLDSLARELGPVPLVLIAEDAVPADVITAIQLGVRGYLPSSLEPAEAIQALRLVCAGGLYLPAAAMAAFCDGSPALASHGNPVQHFGESFGLTPREGDVLARVQQGKANKVIARELELREGTVKVYMRRVMRKLGAHNRTEAALIARRLSDKQQAEPDEGRRR